MNNLKIKYIVDMMKKTLSMLLFFFFSTSLSYSSQIDFDEFNNKLGICPYVKSLTYISKGGSYAAFIIKQSKFKKIDKNVKKGERVVLNYLGNDNWLITIKDKDNRVIIKSGPNRKKLKITKICSNCNNIIKTNRTSPEILIRDNIIQFDLNKHNIKPKFFPIIDRLALELINNPSLKVEIHGHTCTIGDKLYNQILSEKRANALQNYLLKKGIKKNRLSTVGFGYQKPKASNQTEYGKACNRRIEFLKFIIK